MSSIKLNHQEMQTVINDLSDDLQDFLHSRVEEIIQEIHGECASNEQMNDILDAVYYSLYCEVNNKNN
mgnify:CR=1 FL=1